MKEHREKLERIEKKRVYTREGRKQSKTEMWKSAITDHVCKDNHVIDWDSAKIVERECVTG